MTSELHMPRELLHVGSNLFVILRLWRLANYPTTV